VRPGRHTKTPTDQSEEPVKVRVPPRTRGVQVPRDLNPSSSLGVQGRRCCVDRSCPPLVDGTTIAGRRPAPNPEHVIPDSWNGVPEWWEPDSTRRTIRLPSGVPCRSFVRVRRITSDANRGSYWCASAAAAAHWTILIAGPRSCTVAGVVPRTLSAPRKHPRCGGLGAVGIHDHSCHRAPPYLIPPNEQSQEAGSERCPVDGAEGDIVFSGLNHAGAQCKVRVSASRIPAGTGAERGGHPLVKPRPYRARRSTAPTRSPGAQTGLPDSWAAGWSPAGACPHPESAPAVGH